MRSRAAAAALIEQQDVVALRIEQAAVVGAEAGAGSAVEEDGRLARRIAALFPVEDMAIADVERAPAIGLDRGVESSEAAQKLISS